MDLLHKRDYIHSHLHQFDEKIIDEIFEILQAHQLLKSKLESRALRSEDDIRNGKVFERV